MTNGFSEATETLRTTSDLTNEIPVKNSQRTTEKHETELSSSGRYYLIHDHGLSSENDDSDINENVIISVAVIVSTLATIVFLVCTHQILKRYKMNLSQSNQHHSNAMTTFQAKSNSENLGETQNQLPSLPVDMVSSDNYITRSPQLILHTKAEGDNGDVRIIQPHTECSVPKRNSSVSTSEVNAVNIVVNESGAQFVSLTLKDYGGT